MPNSVMSAGASTTVMLPSMTRTPSTTMRIASAAHLFPPARDGASRSSNRRSSVFSPPGSVVAT